MIIIIPRHIMVKRILKNYLDSGVIKQEEEEHTRRLLEQYSDADLAATLVESHMLNPLNLERHRVNFVSEN